MAGVTSKTCWASDLTLNGQDEDGKSEKSYSNEEDKPNPAPVGPLMLSLFEQQLYTDVDFVSKNSKESISAHRVVLAAKSKYFENLLFGKQKNEASEMKMEVEISNMPFGVFKDIIRYFYTDEIRLTDTSYVLDVQAIAEKLDIQALLFETEEYLDALDLDEDNACATLQVANQKYAEQLKKRCIEYIKKNTLPVISSPDFEKCSFATAREICDLQYLNLDSELKMLEAATRWLDAQPEHARAELGRALTKCIRFLSLSRQEFAEAVRRYPDLLPSNDALAILVYLSDPKQKNVNELPKWVNRGRRIFKPELQAFHLRAKRVKIPLKLAQEPQDMTRVASILKMKCIKGFHSIDKVKFSLGGTADERNVDATVVIRTLVLPRVHKLTFKKTIDSRETTFMFDKEIFVCVGQTLHLKVQFTANHPCQFLQFDEAKNDFENEHFECSLASHPSRGKFFVVEEVEYTPRHHHSSFRNFRRKN